MFEEHERVILTQPVPSESLETGDVGVVVHVYEGGLGYEVEFLRLDGSTGAVVTLEADALRAVSSQDITHARLVVGQ